MENQTPQKLTRKTARLQVQQALTSLPDLQYSLGEKKFKRRLQKVEKILSQGLPRQIKLKKTKTDPLD